MDQSERAVVEEKSFSELAIERYLQVSELQELASIRYVRHIILLFLNICLINGTIILL